VLRKIFKPKKLQISEKFRILLHNNKLCHLRRRRRRREDNIQICLREIGYEVHRWIELAQNCDQ
jgi:hypothetical protein